MIFCTFVKSGKQHLDRAGAVGMRSRLLISLVEPIRVSFVFRHLFDAVDDGSWTDKSDAGAASSPARTIVST